MKKEPWYKKEIVLGKVSQLDVVTMTENFSVMLEAGLTVPETLDTLTEQTTGRLQKLLKNVNARVQSGEKLAESFEKEKKAFSPIFVSAIRVGEQTGTLSENLKHLSKQLESDLSIRRDIQGAMLYPAVILSATAILGLSLATFVLPQLASIFDSLSADLPWTTRLVIWVAKQFEARGAIITPSILASFVALYILLRQKFMHPITHKIVLKIPAIKNFIHDLNRARFARGLGTLLSTGVPIQEALKITQNTVSNLMYRRSIQRMYQEIESGESFAKIVSEYPRLYPKMIQRMIAVGERSGTLGETLLYLAKFHEEKVKAQAKNLSTVIEPVLLIFIGLGVGFLAISIFTPIYSITDRLSI